MGQIDEAYNNMFDLSQDKNQRFIMCVLAYLSKDHPIVITLKDLKKYYDDPDWVVSYDMVKFPDEKILDGTITITSRHK